MPTRRSMGGQDAIQHALLTADGRFGQVISQLTEYQCLDCSRIQRAQLERLLMHLQMVRIKVRQYRVGELNYPTLREEEFLENTQHLNSRLEQISEFGASVQEDPVHLLELLGSICPLWPFC